MKITRADAHPTEPGRSEWFTGIVWNEVLATGEAPSTLRVARVTFAPAARTAWHTHPLGQILLAASGIGRVQKAGEPMVTLRPGDTVSIAPGERHWHGSAPDQVFVHVAIQGATPEGQQAVWLEHVTDAEYGPTPG